MKIFIHIGAPKAASSSIQHYFYHNKKINFMGMMRDHEDKNFNNLYEHDFFYFCRNKKDNYEKAKTIRKKLSKKKINVLSDEDFYTSSFGNFKKKIERIISIFPECEFILVLRDPIDTILSWHSFRIRGNKKLSNNIKDFITDREQIIYRDNINYQMRIDYFQTLKNKFHIYDFNNVKNNKLFNMFDKLFNIDAININRKIEKKNQNIYILVFLYNYFPLIKKIKFILPSPITKFLRKILLKFPILINNKILYNNSDLEYLNKVFADEVKYYKSLFKDTSYFILN